MLIQLYFTHALILAVPSALLPPILHLHPQFLVMWPIRSREPEKKAKTRGLASEVSPLSPSQLPTGPWEMADGQELADTQFCTHALTPLPGEIIIKRRRTIRISKRNIYWDIFYVPVTTLFLALLITILDYPHFTNWSHLHKVIPCISTWLFLIPEP